MYTRTRTHEQSRARAHTHTHTHTQVLRAYDEDLNATAHGAQGKGARQESKSESVSVKELPLPAAVPIHVLRVTTPAVEAHAGVDAHALTDSLPHAQGKNVATEAEVGVSPPATTRHLPVPTLPLPVPETSHAAAASSSAPACGFTGSDVQSRMKHTGEESKAPEVGSGQPSGWMHIAQSETPAPSTALPSARSSMECAGRYIIPVICMRDRDRAWRVLTFSTLNAFGCVLRSPHYGIGRSISLPVPNARTHSLSRFSSLASRA